MSSSEQKIAVIKDVVLPIDVSTRYDVYFTDKRIAIVCMGRADRPDLQEVRRPYLMSQVLGGPPPASIGKDSKTESRKIEQEINSLSLDEVLKISKKSCFYTYDEVEKVKLIPGRKPKFIIFSKECISKFSLDSEQFTQLSVLLLKIEMLKDKLLIYGNTVQISTVEKETSTSAVPVCGYCGYVNDFDAFFCQGCGIKIQKQTASSEDPTMLNCRFCGTKNKLEASFCKKCGEPISISDIEKG
jgi:ribosomal protein L40E